MAMGTRNDFVIYPEQFWGGVVEVLQQNTEAFNAASGNVLRLVPRSIKGDYEKEAFMKRTTTAVSHRDPTSTGSLTDTKLTMDEFAGIKVNRRIGPTAMTRDAYKKMQLDPEEFSIQFGQQFGVDIAADYINIAVSCTRAGISGQAGSLQYDTSGGANSLPTTLNHTAMVKGLSKFGDKAPRIKAWVMHSKNYFDLMAQQIADKLFEVAGATVYSGTIATFGKPAIVIDSPSLTTVNGSGVITGYDVLGLVENAAEVAESEDRDIISQPITGQENLGTRIQGEYAFNVRVLGCAWDITNGGINPVDTALANSTYWLKKVSDLKQMPGVRVTCQ